MITELTPRLRRIIAPNPGVMTGEGTNTYIIGREQLAVVDPGPAIESHVDEVLACVGDRLKWIIVTHTHGDHSPAAALLARQTGAPCVGMLSSLPAFQDNSFQPNHILQHDELISGNDFKLRAIHTPGHVDNHFCFLLEDDGVLLAGDHLMNGSTVVIVPPQGDMKAYIDSLERLKTYPIKAIAPGHGELITEPIELIEWTIQHRLKREAKVLEKLSGFSGAVSTTELVKAVYDDVDPQLLPLAEYSLQAHLIKLVVEERVATQGSGAEQRWKAIV